MELDHSQINSLTMVLYYSIQLYFNYIPPRVIPGKLRLVVAPSGLSHLVVECLSESRELQGRLSGVRW